MPAENLLVINVLPENDPKAQAAIQVLKQSSADVQVIHAYEQDFRSCVGCNACWLVTPGICAIKDGYEELLKAYLRCDAVLFLSGTADCDYLNRWMERVMRAYNLFGKHISRFFMGRIAKKLGCKEKLNARPLAE